MRNLGYIAWIIRFSNIIKPFFLKNTLQRMALEKKSLQLKEISAPKRFSNRIN